MNEHSILNQCGFSSPDEVRLAVALVNAAHLLHPLGFLTADEVRECVVECEKAWARHNGVLHQTQTHPPQPSRSQLDGGTHHVFGGSGTLAYTPDAYINYGEIDADDYEDIQYRNDNLGDYSHLLHN